MLKTIHVGTLFGIPVKIHWSFWLLTLLIGFDEWQNNGNLLSLVFALCLVASVFVCVVMHEYGHALMARRFNVNTLDIILTPIGGIARLMGSLKAPKAELLVAIAGPLVNVVIATILLIPIWAFDLPFGLVELSLNNLLDFLKSLLIYLLYINVMLVLFNMIPAFPMDGGRVFRALLGYITTLERATNIARWVSFVLCGCFILYGIYTESYNLIIIGIFIFSAAQKEYQDVVTNNKFEGMNLQMAGDKTIPIVDHDDPLHLYLKDSTIKPMIVNQDEQFIGIVTPQSMANAKKKNDLFAVAGDYTTPIDIEKCVSEEIFLKDIPTQTIEFFERTTNGIIPILSEDGKVRSIIIAELQSQ